MQINGQHTRYLYDGFDIVRGLVGGAPIADLRSLSIDESFVRNGTENYLADAVGSGIALTDTAGTVQTEYAYEPFGRNTVTGAPTNPFQYKVRENDGTGVCYHRARYYQPTVGRFLQEDPTGFVGQETNPYLYVFNNPLKFNDPAGTPKIGYS